MENNTPKISVIIAFYKKFDALNLILLSLKNQKFKNFEIIIAEDDFNEQTPAFLEKYTDFFNRKIKHVFQEKKEGFRKNKILNKAVKISEGEILVFIDGDIIVHKKLLKTYSKRVVKGKLCFGRRVMLSEKLSEKLYRTENLKLLNFFNLIFSGSQLYRFAIYLPFYYKEKKKGIVGCNWGVYKSDITEVNGFDEDFVNAGVGEDNDIEWRLKLYGVVLYSVRYSAITYHLFHKRTYTSKDTGEGYKLLKEKKQQNNYFCKNGINKTI